jgi:hypothetical protein
MLRDETYAQCTVAQVEAMVSSARGFVFEAIGDMWDTLLTGDHLRSSSLRMAPSRDEVVPSWLSLAGELFHEQIADLHQ